MKILLVRPDLPSGINIVVQAGPPLGVMYLSSYLKKHRPGDEVRIADCAVDRLAPKDVADIAAQLKPDIVGISAMSIHAQATREIARLVKAKSPETTVVVGGPHAAASQENILEDENIDIVALGEGEIAFLEIVKAVESKSGFGKIDGIIFRKNGAPLATPPRPPIEDLDSIPYPAWDDVGIEKFFNYKVLTQNNVRAHDRFTTIFTSRACPYRCIYCHNIFGKKFRARSVGNVLDEMSVLHDKYGVREFHIIDDCFNLDIDRAMEVMQGIVDRGWKIKIAFPNGVRADRLPDAFLDLMRRAGVYKMNFGIESGAKRIQALMNKNLDLSMAKNAIDRADRAGFITHGFFMIGFPTETRDEMMETVEFAHSSRLTMAGFFFVQLYPNTKLFDLAKSLGFSPEKIKGEDGCFSDIRANASAVDDAELARIQKFAYRNFYMDPARMARLFLRLPRKLDFWEQTTAHWKVKFK